MFAFKRARPPKRKVKPRRLLVQFLAAAIALVLLVAIVAQVDINLARMGLSIDFRVLGDQAGVEVSDSVIPVDTESTYARLLIVGLINTMIVGALATLLSIAGGRLIVACRLSKNWLVSRAVGLATEAINGIPIVLLLLAVFAILSTVLPHSSELGSDPALAFLTARGLHLAIPGSTETVPMLAAGILFGGAAAWAIWRWPRIFAESGALALLRALAIVGALLAPGLAIWLLFADRIDLAPLLPPGHPDGSPFRVSGGRIVSVEFLALVLALTLYGSAVMSRVTLRALGTLPEELTWSAQALGLGPILTRRRVLLPLARRRALMAHYRTIVIIVQFSGLATLIGFADFMSVATTAMNMTGEIIGLALLLVSVYAVISLLLRIAGALLSNWLAVGPPLPDYEGWR